MQLQRVVKGNLKLLPTAVTAENAPFTNQSRCALRFLRSFEITSKIKSTTLQNKLLINAIVNITDIGSGNNLIYDAFILKFNAIESLGRFDIIVKTVKKSSHCHLTICLFNFAAISISRNKKKEP